MQKKPKRSDFPVFKMTPEECMLLVTAEEIAFDPFPYLCNTVILRSDQGRTLRFKIRKAINRRIRAIAKEEEHSARYLDTPVLESALRDGFKGKCRLSGKQLRTHWVDHLLKYNGTSREELEENSK